MNFLTSLKEYIEANIIGTTLEDFTVLIPGGSDEFEAPFIAITEESSNQIEQAGVIMRGVYQYELTVDMATVPGDAADDATTGAEYEDMRHDFAQIVGDSGMIAWADKREQWRIFDIRAGGVTMIPEDGLRVVRCNLTVIASQLNSNL